MPQTCSICSHAERLQIEALIIAGKSLREIAGQFSLSRNAVHRHKQNCIKPAVQEAKEKWTESTGWNAITEMQWLHDQVHIIYEETRAEKNHRSSIQALAEARKQTELFSELLSGVELSSSEQVEQEWVNVREILFHALEPYPEAKLAVARALLALGRDEVNREISL